MTNDKYYTFFVGDPNREQLAAYFILCASKALEVSGAPVQIQGLVWPFGTRISLTLRRTGTSPFPAHREPFKIPKFQVNLHQKSLSKTNSNKIC